MGAGHSRRRPLRGGHRHTHCEFVPKTNVQESLNVDSSWILEYVSDYISSPDFQTAVQSFLDDKCIVFDSDEENQLVYTEIHQEYKCLVEALLTQGLTMAGITSEQYQNACQSDVQAAMDNSTMLYVRAVDDFLVFKNIMVGRNRELEEQVLRYLNNQQSAQASPFADLTEDEQLALAIAESLAIHDRQSDHDVNAASEGQVEGEEFRVPKEYNTYHQDGQQNMEPSAPPIEMPPVRKMNSLEPLRREGDESAPEKSLPPLSMPDLSDKDVAKINSDVNKKKLVSELIKQRRLSRASGRRFELPSLEMDGRKFDSSALTRKLMNDNM